MEAVLKNEAVSQKRAAQAGLIATLIMLTTQLIWRLGWSQDPLVPALPEYVVAAISRLTPLAIFGAATENYGGMAKKVLFVSVLIGIIVVGRFGGIIAGRMSNKTSGTFLHRLSASGIVATVLFLFVMVVVMPIAHLGLFATDSSYPREGLMQLTVTFALYALVWSVFTVPALSEEPAVGDATVDRRSVLSQGLIGGAILASVLALGATTWRLLNPKSASLDSAAAEKKTVDIVATQRARQGNPMPTAVPSEEAALAESASLNSDVNLQADDPFALFNELDASGRLTPVLTATPDFYHVSKNISDPIVSSDGWTLKINGLVDKELEFSHEELLARATTYNITTLCCISNELNGSLISTAEWLGVPLAELLAEAGIREGAIDLKFSAADDYQDSVTIERGLDPDNLVVVGMNGEMLPDFHGFPARLIIPNIYGMKNVKWLNSIEIVNEDFIGYWESRDWSDIAETNIWGRIDYPEKKAELDAGSHVLAGMASAGDRDISRVEISLDDGSTWADATLEPSLNPPFTWVRWAFPVDLQSGEYTMRLRATDGTGAVATQDEQRPLPDGATGWPKRGFKVKG